MENTTDSNETLPTLEELNAEETQKMLPILVFYVIVMVVGLIGNALVIAVYTHKLKRSSARWYILSLAVLDFSVCFVGIPYHVLDLTFQYTYTHLYVCKSLSLLMSILNFGSVFILNVVAIDRYLKVCRPLKKQVVDFGARKACLVAFVIAVLVSWPNGVLYGHSSVETRIKDLYGIQCFFDDVYEGGILHVAFQGFVFLCFIGTILFLIIVYYLIWRQIYKSINVQVITAKDNRSRRFCFCCDYGTVDDDDDDEEDEYDEDDEENEERDESGERASINGSFAMEVKDGNQGNQSEPEIQHDTGEEGVIGSVVCKTPIDTDDKKAIVEKKKSEKQRNSKKGKRNTKSKSTIQKASAGPVSSLALVRHQAPGGKGEDKKSRKITIMMFTITVVFITSYFPFCLISLADNLDDEFWDGISHAQSLLYEILLRTYLFNNIANPIIYGFWDKRFRGECKRLLKNICCCCCRRKGKKDLNYAKSSTDHKFMSYMSTKTDCV